MQSQFISSIHNVDSVSWNRLCDSDYPFLRHEFFATLEDSGSTCRETGWQVHHLLIRDGQKLVAFMPLFIKYHSYGEYVFDWAWAEAWYRHGYEYYPKLLCAIPFTPAAGPRWGISAELSETKTMEAQHMLFDTVEEEARKIGVDTGHWLFIREQDRGVFRQRGYPERIGCQYHWLNQNHKNFDTFLSGFNSRKRKNINRERRRVREQGIELIVKEGADISPEEWHNFYCFYHLTYLKRSGRQGYLTEEFFPLLANRLSEHLVMAQAFKNRQMVAAALYLKDRTTLYGRYWGCLQEYDQLHFETCYYQGIEYAIENKLQRFDPGAQGEHKIQRGFTPVFTWSCHWIGNDHFTEPIAGFLELEAREIQRYQKAACAKLPFKTPDQ